MFYNQVKTVILLASLSGILLLIGGLIGGAEGIFSAFMLSLIMNGVAYFFSDSIVLTIYNAKQLDQARHANIYAMVHELCKSMHLPMPKLWLVDTKMANAFATGRNPEHASVAVTSGILDLLDEGELRGVLAHELSHVKNRDTLVTTIAATLASTIGYIARMFQFGFFSRRDKEHGGINAILALVIALLMPLAAVLIQLAISRSREFLADEVGARSCHDPLALASALEKLHNHIPHAGLDRTDPLKATTAPLFIVQPFSGKSWLSLFSTHPPLQARIERLKAMYKKMF